MFLHATRQVRRQIMEQDEVYHRAMDEAGRKIQDGKGGVNKDGRPFADDAKRQRQAIQAEQVPFRLGLSILLTFFCHDWAV